MDTLTIHVQIYSDMSCAWCYLGKIVLDRAMAAYAAQHPGVQFELSWNPFYLFADAEVSGELSRACFFPLLSLLSHPFVHRSPMTPAQPPRRSPPPRPQVCREDQNRAEHTTRNQPHQERPREQANKNPLYSRSDPKAYDKTTYYIKKFGPAGAPAVLARVRREAAALGLPLTFEGRTGNTRDSHLLLLLAQRRSQRHLAAMQAALFRGIFEEGRDVSDRGFLLEAAAEAGLLEGPSEDGGGEGDEEHVLAWLDGREGRELVDALERRAKAVVGIAAVPSFVVQGKFRVGGKQEEGVFLDLFERIRSEEGGGRVDKGV